MSDPRFSILMTYRDGRREYVCDGIEGDRVSAFDRRADAVEVAQGFIAGGDFTAYEIVEHEEARVA